MASSTPSNDITETVCQYPDCSKQLDPKLLPCLHRYCRECLTSVIQSASEGMLKCLVCKQDCEIPEKGVDGFKTDLHMTGRLLLNKLQDSFVNKDQKQVTVNPIGADHVANEALLYCCKCGGLPICVICGTSIQKFHYLGDVSELANKERKLLEAKLLDNAKQREDIDAILTCVTAVLPQQEKKYTILELQLEISKGYAQKEKTQRRIQAVKKTLNASLEDEMKMWCQIYGQESKEVGEKHDKIQADCQQNQENIKKYTQELLATGQIVRKLKRISDFGKQLIERNKNVKATSLSILDSKHFWSEVQCIYYFRKDIESLTPLVKDMEQEFTQLARELNLSGTFKCDASDCVVCSENIVISININSHTNKRTYNPDGHITCVTPSVIYLINCNICDVQYVGKTKNTLKQRITKHRCEVGPKGQGDTKFVKHFKSHEHSKTHIRVQGITSSCKDLHREEKEWMIKLGTTGDYGLNTYVGNV